MGIWLGLMVFFIQFSLSQHALAIWEDYISTLCQPQQDENKCFSMIAQEIFVLLYSIWNLLRKHHIRHYQQSTNFPFFSVLQAAMLRQRSNGVQYWLWIPERSFAKPVGEETPKQFPHSHLHSQLHSHITFWYDIFNWTTHYLCSLQPKFHPIHNSKKMGLGLGRLGQFGFDSGIRVVAILAEKSCKLEKNGHKLEGKLCL